MQRLYFHDLFFCTYQKQIEMLLTFTDMEINFNESELQIKNMEFQ